jgi:hypothetical protein
MWTISHGDCLRFVVDLFTSFLGECRRDVQSYFLMRTIRCQQPSLPASDTTNDLAKLYYTALHGASIGGPQPPYSHLNSEPSDSGRLRSLNEDFKVSNRRATFGDTQVFGDESGYFYESFRSDLLSESFGETINFVQANQSYSKDAGTVRGCTIKPPSCAGQVSEMCCWGYH